MRVVVPTMLFLAVGLGRAEPLPKAELPTVGKFAPKLTSPKSTWVNTDKPISLRDRKAPSTLVVFSTVY